ncbi:hypothetical protein ABNIH4_10081, partial [Acinetobacter baumannii ABNIH4]
FYRYLVDLLDQIPQDERVDSVYTDGAYDPNSADRSLRIGKHMQ